MKTSKTAQLKTNAVDRYRQKEQFANDMFYAPTEEAKKEARVQWQERSRNPEVLTECGQFQATAHGRANKYVYPTIRYKQLVGGKWKAIKEADLIALIG